MSRNIPALVAVQPSHEDRGLATDRARLATRYQAVRRVTEELCAPLETEDYVVQSMPDASPAKWHLAHTSWFFETMILGPEGAAPRSRSSEYAYLFNSYYNSLGERIARTDRGLITRPTVAEVYRYRAAVDQEMLRFLDRASDDVLGRIGPTIVLGLHHEQQHQELILTDLKYLFSRNPLRPIYREQEPADASQSGPSTLGWVSFPAGLRPIGHEGDTAGFAFDNERPRHPVYVAAFGLADRLVTVGDYLAFMTDGGYARPELWLSDGWNACTTNRWTAPLYWEESSGGWRIMTLAGMRDLLASEPVCHVSFYEADAYARWAGARLATEAEWEVAAREVAPNGNFLETALYHPAPLSTFREGEPPGEPRSERARQEPCPPQSAQDRFEPRQLFGDVWEWTQSSYTPYPGYRPLPGALGEYNGKFMCNQHVLRGGSCATPGAHIRATYRNFFPPEARWQFSGIRLAQDA